MLVQFTICDSTYHGRALIASMINNYFSNKPIFTVNIVRVSSKHELLASSTNAKECDFLFLNASSNVNDAIDTVDELRDRGFKGKAVFLVNHSDKMHNAYMHSASGFLSLPVSFGRFVTLLDRLTGIDDDKTIAVQNGTSYSKLSLHDITFIECMNGKCMFHMSNGETLSACRTLCGVEKEMSDGRFLRCHRSFLVNMDHITGMDKQFILDTGECVMIKQRHIPSVRGAVIDYYKRKKAKEEGLL